MRYLNLCLIIVSLVAVTACQDNTAQHTWEHDKAGLLTATFSKDGQYALISTINKPARLIDVASNKVLHQWQHTDSNEGIIHTAMSADNKLAVTAQENSLALWEIPSGKITGYWDFPSITDIVLDKTGRHALIGLDNHKAYYFDIYYGKILHTFEHEDSINTVALSGNGELAITGDLAGHVKLWQLPDGQLTQQWQHNFKIYKVALSDDGQYAMSNASLGKTRLWNTQTGTMLSQLPMRYMTVSAATFSPDSQSLLTGRPNQRIDIWDVKTGELKRTWYPTRKNFWQADASAIIALAYSADGKSFFSERSNGVAQKWLIDINK